MLYIEDRLNLPVILTETSDHLFDAVEAMTQMTARISEIVIGLPVGCADLIVEMIGIALGLRADLVAER